MKDQSGVALYLKVARNNAGLRQTDVAHLLGVQKARISRIENGKALPTILETAKLSIVYGKEMESLLSGLIDQIVRDLVERMQTMPSAPRKTPETFNRVHTLSSLARRLEVITTTRHAGA